MGRPLEAGDDVGEEGAGGGMYEHWHDFYILVGSAAGALIGLMFVVVTLTSNLDRDQALKGASHYMTPTVTEFAAVLLIAAVAAAPLDADLQNEALLALALVLSAWTLFNVWRMFFRPLGGHPTHWTDPWWYAVAPAASYLALALAALAASPVGVGAVAVAILLLGIRNAWDLITWIAPQGSAKSIGGATPPPE
jgi:hypothetical protein